MTFLNVRSVRSITSLCFCTLSAPLTHPLREHGTRPSPPHAPPGAPGFGPATAGFLTTLNRSLVNEDGTPLVESKAMPGMPPQVICYESAESTSS